MRTLLHPHCIWFFLLPLFATGQSINVMPYPSSVEMGQGEFLLDTKFTIALQGAASDRLEGGTSRWLRRLDERTGLFFSQEFVALDPTTRGALTINISRKGELILGENESYSLSIRPNHVKINAETDLGALHALETLLQLLQADYEGYSFPCLEIKDGPRFPWRGLMIDVARHFQPMEVIKRNIDAMAVVKMNVLHLHLSDDQGFRVESKVFPKLHEEASDGLFFSQVQIGEIIQYADQRGIRVYPEFDVPGHATAILTAYPHLGSAPGPYQLQKHSGIFDPTLNPTIEETYTFLHELFIEMAGLFPDEYFHIGGDENEGHHWNNNQSIQEFMKEHGFKDNHELQGYFTSRVLKSLNTAGKKMIGWDEILHPGLPKEAVIHSWRGWEYMSTSAKQGYATVLSKGYYIDLMQPASAHYLNDPLPPDHDLTNAEVKNILGGEATMWSELVTPLTIDSRIWPRTAAIAERLWSLAHINDVDDMYARLKHISLRLEEAGSMHIRNQAVIMRNLTGGRPTSTLKTLLDVVEPMKGYTRNPEGTLYTTYSPYTLFADAATADAPAARKFNALVNKYLARPSETRLKEIVTYLELWEANHEKLLPVIHASPILKEIETMSFNLSKLAGYTLQIINNRNVRAQASPPSRYRALDELTQKAYEQGGRTELQVVASMEKLVKSHTGKIDAPYIQGKIMIDGDLMEWENSSWGHLLPGPATFLRDTCFYALQWDEKNLYLALQVRTMDLPKKDYHGETQGPGRNVGLRFSIDLSPDPWQEKKGKEIFFHIDALTSTGNGKPLQEHHPCKHPNGHFFNTSELEAEDSHDLYTGKGYQIEAAIKWDDLGKVPQRHELLGMHLHLDKTKEPLDGAPCEKENLPELQYLAGVSQLVLLD